MLWTLVQHKNLVQINQFRETETMCKKKLEYILYKAPLQNSLHREIKSSETQLCTVYLKSTKVTVHN